jgi:hypothetical protein
VLLLPDSEDSLLLLRSDSFVEPISTNTLKIPVLDPIKDEKNLTVSGPDLLATSIYGTALAWRWPLYLGENNVECPVTRAPASVVIIVKQTHSNTKFSLEISLTVMLSLLATSFRRLHGR